MGDRERMIRDLGRLMVFSRVLAVVALVFSLVSCMVNVVVLVWWLWGG